MQGGTLWLMKSARNPMPIVAVVALLTAVTASPAAHGQTLPPKSNTNGSTGPEAEARSLILRIWEQEYVKCGESYFAYNAYMDGRGRLIRVYDTGPKEIAATDYLKLIEYRGVSRSITVAPESVSNADRLNGVE